MVKIGDLYMDGYLKNNLDVARDVIRKDWDMILLVDGAEGSGKSVLAMQMAFYCDPTLNISRVVFTHNEFRKAIMAAKPYEAVVYDEAYTGLSSRATMSLINRTLIGMLAEIRQRNLFVFVVMPCFFDLDKYAALWRSRALVHVYIAENFQRGYFSFFNVERKKQLYMLGKKFYSYYKPPANFIGRFTGRYVLDENEYREKKRLSLTNREKHREEQDRKAELEAELFERMMLLPDNVPHETRIKILDMPRSTYQYKKKAWEENHAP